MSEELTDLQKEVVLQAKRKAMKLLEFSDRTEKQLRDKLKEGEFPPFAVDAAIEYVSGLHYIDDARYAENFIRGKYGLKSRFEIRMALKERGVSDDVILEKLDLAEENDELSDRETIKTLFRKKYGRKDLTDPKVYEKAFRYFAGKGFRYDDIRSAVEEALNANEDFSF